jgi:hypothetical protein
MLLPSTKKEHERIKVQDERAKADRYYRSRIRTETELWLSRSRSELETRFYHTVPVRAATQELCFDLERLLDTYDDRVWASFVHHHPLTLDLLTLDP